MANKSFELNEKIIIELNNGKKLDSEFVQDIQEGIIVKNSRDLKTNRVYKHNQTFYVSEIKSVYAAKQPTVERSDPNENQPNTSNQCVERQHTFHTDEKQFSELEIKDIRNSMINHVYIAQFDDKYHNAIVDMKKQKIIAVNSESVFGRLDIKRPLIAVATSNHVYLFDMLRLGPMKKEFKQIFQSDSPRKIVHSSAEIADYLFHIEKCQLKNAFDTLMVHFSLKQTRERLPLQKCFPVYFNLPDDFALQEFNYNIRPLTTEALMRSALNVLLLVELYWYLNDVLMTPLRNATQQFLETYPNVENQVDLMTHMNNGVYPGAENIDINGAYDLEDALNLLQTN